LRRDAAQPARSPTTSHQPAGCRAPGAGVAAWWSRVWMRPPITVAAPSPDEELDVRASSIDRALSSQPDPLFLIRFEQPGQPVPDSGLHEAPADTRKPAPVRCRGAAGDKVEHALPELHGRLAGRRARRTPRHRTQLLASARSWRGRSLKIDGRSERDLKACFTDLRCRSVAVAQGPVSCPGPTAPRGPARRRGLRSPAPGATGLTAADPGRLERAV